MSLVPPHVASLQPYIPGKPIEEVEREYGVTDVAKLASNENALGPSPLGLRAAREAAARVHLYPDGSAYFLKRAISERFGVPMDEVLVGNGSNEIIELIVRTFVREGEEVLTSAQSFVAYKLAAHAHGRKLVEAPMRERFHYDLDAIAARITPATKVIFLANPDNPTGTWFLEDELRRFLARVPPGVLVVLDEAYVEFVEAEGFQDSLSLRRERPDLLVVRTFSKIYGLAGLRLGYAFARPELIAFLDRVRAPFNVNAIAQAAGAAALEDEEHVELSRALVRDQRPFLEQGLAELGATVVPSQANFVLADFPGQPGMKLFDALLREAVVVRPVAGYGFPTAQRITVGTRAENVKVLAALRKVLGR